MQVAGAHARRNVCTWDGNVSTLEHMHVGAYARDMNICTSFPRTRESILSLRNRNFCGSGSFSMGSRQGGAEPGNDGEAEDRVVGRRNDIFCPGNFWQNNAQEADSLNINLIEG
jgi:hypothetical protein